MARPIRGSIEAGLYHVWRRSAGPIDMFVDDVDRIDFCNRLDRVITRFNWKCHGFCMMNTHYHLIVSVDCDMLQPGMHMLNAQYAQQFNRRWARKGHLKGSQYGSRPLDDDEQFLRCYRYVALNPVDARLCDHPAKWRWSSYRGAAGYGTQFRFVDDSLVLGMLDAADRTRARQLLRALVEPYDDERG
jgi:REP element-mobilizing transposase RayT